MRTRSKVAMLVVLCLVGFLTMGITYNEPLRKITTVLCYNLTTYGTATIVTADITTANITTEAVTTSVISSLTLTEEILANSAVSLTSPTTTFSVADKGLVTLNSDANQTGIYPTGGTLRQVVVILSGAGSNTMRFDDSAASMTIGGNVTLTETQNDILTLICTSADGDEWAAVSAHDN